MNLDNFKSIAKDPIPNFYLPGLTRWALGPGLWLFEASRATGFNPTPHSHRFESEFQVLCGALTHRLWTPGSGDPYRRWESMADTEKGFIRGVYDDLEWGHSDQEFTQGEEMFLMPDDIHSLAFARGTCVLFNEAEQCQEHNFILEPLVNGIAIPTHDPQPWMFK